MLSSPATRRRLRAVLVTLTVGPLLALAACSSSNSSSSSSTGAASSAPASNSSAAAVSYPVTVTADNGDVAIPARPTSIVVLGPTLSEMLFAIGAGPQVKAVDDQSDYPTTAPHTKLSAFKPNAEAIAAYQPDLVVVTNDIGGLVAALTKLKVPVLLLGAPKTIDGSYTQELALGKATGHVAEAQQVVDRTRQGLAAAVASVPSAKGLKVYHELDQTYYSVTSDTFIGDLYKQFGMANIADKSPKAAGGYPQLSAEFVVAAAPDLIVLADGKCCGQSVDTVAKRPAFASVPAVTKKHVLVVDDDIASRWGPRVVDFAKKIAENLTSAG